MKDVDYRYLSKIQKEKDAKEIVTLGVWGI
jgi:hypothetical protein